MVKVTKDIIEFLGLWEMLHSFKPIEFEGFISKIGGREDG